MCKWEEEIFRQPNHLIFSRLERRFFQDDLPVETNKLMTERHKFTLGGQMPDDLSIQTIRSSSNVKMSIDVVMTTRTCKKMLQLSIMK